jgi:pyruvate dehydrogenase E2 component (dihydrolipoamide acetyltransferase)
MNFEFKLPDIGEGLVEGEIVKWFVKVGDTVAEHQPLASVLTDKAEVEIPSPKAGKIVKLFGKPGEKVKVHAPLATFEIAGGASSAPAAAAPAAPAPKANGKAEKVEKPSAAAKAAVAVAPTPAPSSGGEYVFNLPDLGEGLVEGELVKWHVKVGDAVAEHQPVAAVLTDKAEVEVPSPKSGKVLQLHGKPGAKVKVHAPLITFSVAGGASAPAQAAAPAPAPEAAAPKTAAAPAPSRPAVQETDVRATPMTRKLAKDLGVDITQISGTGPEGRILEADVRGAKERSSQFVADVRAINATPAVRALAASSGVELSTIKGTGPGGRIVEGDVRAAAPKRPAGSAARPAAGPLNFTAPAAASQGEEKVPYVGIRRKIGDKMAQSKHTVADVTHMDECDMTALLALRDELKPEAAKRGVKLTFLAFIIKALTKSLAEFPAFNASLNEEAGEITLKRYYNVGIAVAAPQGLVVPNIKGADGKDLFGLAAEVSALADKVRANKIEVASLQGGTFTITNIGPIGGLFATPIVNHPEVAILGLMKLQKRPVVRDGGIAIRDMMNLVLTFDHRVTDGADAANFMNTLIRHLENPRTLV